MTSKGISPEARARYLANARSVRHERAVDRIRRAVEAAGDEAMRHVPAHYRAVIQKRVAGSTLQDVADAVGITKEGAAWRQREGLRVLAVAGLVVLAQRLVHENEDRAALEILAEEVEW